MAGEAADGMMGVEFLVSLQRTINNNYEGGWIMIIKKTRLFSIFCGILIVFGLSGCGGGDGDAPAPLATSRSFTQDTAAVTGHDSASLIAEIARIARGGMLLKGKLRPAAFPSGHFVSQPVIGQENTARAASSFVDALPINPTAGCPVVTQPEKLTSQGFSVTVDYGAGCIDAFDAVTRSGKIVLKFSDIVIDLKLGEMSSASLDWTLENYTIGESKVQGAINIKIVSPVSEAWDVNLTATRPASTRTLAFKATITTANDTDIETINGTGIFNDSVEGNTSFTMSDLQFDHDNLRTPLVCSAPIGGTLTMTGKNTAKLDFGVPAPGCGFAMTSIDGGAPASVFLKAPSAKAKTDLSASFGVPYQLYKDSSAIYVLNIENKGLFAAHDVIATFSFNGVSFQSVSVNAGACSGSEQITCTANLGTLNPGQNSTISVYLTPTGEGMLNASAAVTADAIDIDKSNDTFSKSTQVTVSNVSPFPPSRVVITESNTSIPFGNTSMPVGGIQPLAFMIDGGYFYSDATWASSQPDVASVDKNGRVLGLKPGNTMITATVRGVTSEPVSVTVTTDEIRKLKLAAKDLIYDRFAGKVYASVPGSDGVIGNSLTVIDPATGEIGASYFVGSEPGKLAISDDGKYVYVALNGESAISRFNTQTQVVDVRLITLSVDGTGAPRYAYDIAVLPGKPESVVVSMVKKSSNEGAGVVVFDNAVQRPVSVDTEGRYSARAIESSASGSEIYSNEGGDLFSRMQVDSSGLSIMDVVYSAGMSGDIKFDNGFVYSPFGAIINSQTRSPAGIFNLFGGAPWSDRRFVMPDFVAGRTFFLHGGAYPYLLEVFDQTTYRLLGSLKITPISSDYRVVGPNNLIRWGANGLAFSTQEGEVYLVRSRLVNGSP